MSSDHPVIFALSDTRVMLFLAAILVVGSAILLYQKSTEVVYPEVMISQVSGETETSVSQVGSGDNDVSSPRTRKIVVNINTAGADSLAMLPGIGDVIAVRIIAYREKNGPFASHDDLMKVAGIGDAKLRVIKGLITLDSK